MANGTNTPIGRIFGGAQQVSNFIEGQQLSPLRRRSAEVQARGQELGLQQQEAETTQFLDRVQRSDMARAAADFLAIPEGDIAGQDAFLDARIADLEARNIDTQDTAGMFQLDPVKRRQAAQAILQIAQQFGDVGQKRTGPSDPSAVQEFQFFQGLSPAEKKTFINIKRAQPGSTLSEVEGRKVAFNRGTGEITELSTAAGEREAAAKEVTATTTAREEASIATERADTAPIRFEKARSSIAQIDQTVNTINEAIGLAGQGTAGFAALLDFIPQSGPRELRNAIDTIQANLGFDRLQAMRDASKTGGALGAVSERELKFLTSTLTNLDTKAKPETLKKNLKKALNHYDKWRSSIINARGRDLMRDGLSQEAAAEQLATEFNL